MIRIPPPTIEEQLAAELRAAEREDEMDDETHRAVHGFYPKHIEQGDGE